MRMLVEMLSKKELKDIMKHFVNPHEIKILESIEKGVRNSSFYIEENIENIEALIDKLTKYNPMSRNARKDNIDPETFDLFRWLITEIYKYRFMGTDSTDIEFIYEKLRDRFNISIVMSDTLKGFKFYEQQEVIVAKSGIYTLYLTHDEGWHEFYFWVHYIGKTRFRKKDVIKNSHWNTNNILETLEDFELFMKQELPKKIY